MITESLQGYETMLIHPKLSSPAHRAHGAQRSPYLFMMAVTSLFVLGSVGCSQDESESNSMLIST